MKRKKIFLIALTLISFWPELYSQSKEYRKAMDFYTVFIKEGKVADINKAYETATLHISNPENLKIDQVHFYFGLITKQYYESNQKMISNKHELIGNAFHAFKTTYLLNKNFPKKEQLLKLIQIIGFDLYSEGIVQFKAKNFQEAYTLQKNVVEAQSILAENKMDLSFTTREGEKLAISSSEIINNLVVYCVNLDKKEEAKTYMEKDLEINPSALKYTQLIQLCGQLGFDTEKNKYIDAALIKFPTDEDILIIDINRNIELKNTSIALDKIEKAKKTTSNPVLFLIGSQLYSELQSHQNATTILEEGLVKFPNDYDMNYNYGVNLFNSALASLNNDLGRTSNKGHELLAKAKTYFLKAKAINPEKVNIDKVLKDIEDIK